MERLDQETAMMARAWGILQDFGWGRHKAWGKVAEATMFLLIAGTFISFFIFIVIATGFSMGDLGILAVAAPFLLMALHEVSVFRRFHNRYFLKFHTLRAKKMDAWIDAVLRGRGIGFQKVPSTFLQRRSLKASLLYTYRLEDRVTDLLLLDGAAEVIICLGPAKEANKEELKELMSLITASLVGDQKRIIEMAVEDEELFKEDLGELLIRLSSKEDGQAGLGEALIELSS